MPLVKEGSGVVNDVRTQVLCCGCERCLARVGEGGGVGEDVKNEQTALQVRASALGCVGVCVCVLVCVYRGEGERESDS